MFAPLSLLARRESALKQRLGLGIAPLNDVDLRQVVENRNVYIRGFAGSLAHGEGVLEQGLGLRVAALSVESGGLVIQMHDFNERHPIATPSDQCNQGQAHHLCHILAPADPAAKSWTTAHEVREHCLRSKSNFCLSLLLSAGRLTTVRER